MTVELKNSLAKLFSPSLLTICMALLTYLAIDAIGRLKEVEKSGQTKTVLLGETAVILKSIHARLDKLESGQDKLREFHMETP